MGVSDLTMDSNGYILGIESTAHTFSIGVADSNGYPLDSVSVAVRPLKGGIHPREAADHHAEKGADVLQKLLKMHNLNQINFA